MHLIVLNTNRTMDKYAAASPDETDEDKRYALDDQALDNFEHVCNKYEISKVYREDLGGLSRFEICIIVDDSGSMTWDNGHGSSRWEELKSILNIIVDLGGALDDDGMDIFFLNRKIDKRKLLSHQVEALEHIKDAFGNPHLRVVPKVRTFDQVSWVFERDPMGYTPLEETARPLIESKTGKPKLIIFATDGIPTDREGNVKKEEFERALKNRDVTRSFIGILLCSDKEDEIGYANGMDKRVKNLDVIDDYESEKKEVMKKQTVGFRYTLGDHVARLLLGPTNKKYDKQDESKVGQITEDNPNGDKPACCVVS